MWASRSQYYGSDAPNVSNKTVKAVLVPGQGNKIFIKDLTGFGTGPPNCAHITTRAREKLLIISIRISSCGSVFMESFRCTV